MSTFIYVLLHLHLHANWCNFIMKQKINDSPHHSNALCNNKVRTAVLCLPIYFLPVFLCVFFLFTLQIKKKLLCPKNSKVRCYCAIGYDLFYMSYSFKQHVSVIHSNSYWNAENTKNKVATPFIIEKWHV